MEYILFCNKLLHYFQFGGWSEEGILGELRFEKKSTTIIMGGPPPLEPVMENLKTLGMTKLEYLLLPPLPQKIQIVVNFKYEFT